MPVWLDYAPADFLLFSARVYWRLFALANEALWPLPVLAPFAGLAALALALRRPLPGWRLLAALLAAGWLVVGWSFVWQRYAEINWTAVYLVPLFALQALLLAGAAMRRQTAPAAGAHAGVAVTLYALVLHPLTALTAGRTVATAEIVGIAPDPTAFASVGLALMLPAGGMRAVLLAIPILWLAVSAATLATLGESVAILPLLAILVGLTVPLVDRFRRR